MGAQINCSGVLFVFAHRRADGGRPWEAWRAWSFGRGEPGSAVVMHGLPAAADDRRRLAAVCDRLLWCWCHSSTRRTMDGGLRPARVQPVRAAATGTPRIVMARYSSGTRLRVLRLLRVSGGHRQVGAGGSEQRAEQGHERMASCFCLKRRNISAQDAGGVSRQAPPWVGSFMERRPERAIHVVPSARHWPSLWHWLPGRLFAFPGLTIRVPRYPGGAASRLTPLRLP